MSNSNPTRTLAFLVAVEIDPTLAPTPEVISQHLRYGLKWIDGIESVDVEALGEIDVYPDPLDTEGPLTSNP